MNPADHPPLVISANGPRSAIKRRRSTHRGGAKHDHRVHSRFIADALGSLTAPEVTLELGGPLAPGVIKIVGDPDYLHVVMPLRIPASRMRVSMLVLGRLPKLRAGGVATRARRGRIRGSTAPARRTSRGGPSRRARRFPVHAMTEMVRWGATTARVRTSRPRRRPSRGDAAFAPPDGERRRPRRYLLDGAGKRSEDAVGELVVVAFFPEDVDLLVAAPSARRRFLDAMLGQIDRAHRREMRELQRVLEQRNALLRAARDELELPEEEMAFWDRELIRLSAAISLRRVRLVDELHEPFVAATELFTGADGLALAYAGQVDGSTLEERAAAYQQVLREKRERERWQGTSLVGPQRDDLAVTSAGRALPEFASRGEHRSAVLALKIAEAAWLTSRVGEQPVFLLDDVLSELDPARREALARAIPEDAQTRITAAISTGAPDTLRERATSCPSGVARSDEAHRARDTERAANPRHRRRGRARGCGARLARRGDDRPGRGCRHHARGADRWRHARRPCPDRAVGRRDPPARARAASCSAERAPAEPHRATSVRSLAVSGQVGDSNTNAALSFVTTVGSTADVRASRAEVM